MKCNRRNFLLGVIGSTLTASVLCGSQPEEKKSSNLLNQSTSSPPDLLLLLHCIAMVGSEDDDTKVGPNGERSKYQVSYDVWRQHNGFLTPSKLARMHFQQCCCKDGAKICAATHLRWLDRNLPRISITEVHFRPYALAWAWHGGLESWTLQDKPYYVSTEKRIRCNNYATQVTNLYDELSRTKQIPRH